MKCYKCNEEMIPTSDTAWRVHKTGEKRRMTEFICAKCRVYVYLEVDDYSECINLEVEE